VQLASPPLEAFAAGSFLDMTEAERLVAPAYVDEPCGLAALTNVALQDGQAAARASSRRVLRIAGNAAGRAAVEQPSWQAPAPRPLGPQPPRGPRVRVSGEKWRAGGAGAGGTWGSYAFARQASGNGLVHRAAEDLR
jgi:hypothetical protein